MRGLGACYKREMWYNMLLRLNLEAASTETYETANAVLANCTVTKDSTLASDMS